MCRQDLGVRTGFPELPHEALQTPGLNTTGACLPQARRAESSVEASDGWVPPAGCGGQPGPGFRGGPPSLASWAARASPPRPFPASCGVLPAALVRVPARSPL